MGLSERLSNNNRKSRRNARTGNHSVIHYCIGVNHSIFQIQNLASHSVFRDTVIEETAVCFYSELELERTRAFRQHEKGTSRFYSRASLFEASEFKFRLLP